MADRIRVNAPGGDYEIWIDPGAFGKVGEQEGEAPFRPYLGTKVVVATNTTLAPLYGEALVAKLPDARLVTMPDGEAYKTLDTVAQLYRDFVDAGLNRDGTVIALGGGVVGDTVGFAAATYMRGVRFVQIPTTLLSMVDSSVGGKVGVDLPQGKNLVGAFKQPDRVLVDPEVLKTLPEREWRCGMAEVIKHGLLADEGLLEMAGAPTGKNDAIFASELVRRAVQVKVDVIQQDPFEKGIRAHLNLGHTFGHAVEQVSGYSWLHGEAVGIGLIAAARLSYALTLCDANLPERVEKIVTAIGLPNRLNDVVGELINPTPWPPPQSIREGEKVAVEGRFLQQKISSPTASLNGFDPETLYAAMGTDKKKQGGKLRFVLLRGIGQPVIVDHVPKEAVLDVLRSLQA